MARIKLPLTVSGSLVVDADGQLICSASTKWSARIANALLACDSLWDSFGEDLVNDEPIQGSDCVEALCQVGEYVRSAATGEPS